MPHKKSIPQQLNSLIKNIEKTSNGQASVDLNMLAQTDNPECIFVEICPKEGPYKHGNFLFEILLSDGYPHNPPIVSCHTPVYHPNIEFDDLHNKWVTDTSSPGHFIPWTFRGRNVRETKCPPFIINVGLSRLIVGQFYNGSYSIIDEGVCLSMLDEWTGDMDLEDIVMGLLFLMQNPQLDDPLNGMFRGDEKYSDFVRKVRKSLKGQLKDSNGHHFERNWHRPSNGTPSDSESEVELEAFSNPSTPDIFDTSDDNIHAVARLGRDSEEMFDRERRHPAVNTLNGALSLAVFGMVTVVVSTFVIYKCIKKFL